MLKSLSTSTTIKRLSESPVKGINCRPDLKIALTSFGHPAAMMGRDKAG
jgi:hypothetical protein